MKKAVILFTRVPLSGPTKTRMQSLLSMEEAAELQACMIRDIGQVCWPGEWDTFVYGTPDKECPKLKTLFLYDVCVKVQSGSGLGEKMYNAIEQVLGKGYEACILLGSDIPHIKKTDLEKAFQILETTDVVLGPTKDKGYYLVGMSRTHKEVFERQQYGAGEVLKNTLVKIRNAGLSVGLLSKYNDMDVPYDLYEFLTYKENEKCEEGQETFAYVQHLREVYIKKWNELKV